MASSKSSKSSARLQRDIDEVLSRAHSPKRVGHAKQRHWGDPRVDVEAWIEKHDNLAPEHWLAALIDGDYTLAEMRAAILENRQPRATKRKSNKEAINIDGDVDSWVEYHDNLAPQHWLMAVLDGDYTLVEMRRAILEDRSPRPARRT